MGIVLTIIFGVMLGVSLILPSILEDTESSKKLIKNLRIATGVVLLLTVAVNCIKVIPANNVGVKYSIFTGTSENTLDEGVVFKAPFDKIYLIDTTVQERSIEGVTGQTKDAQWLKMDLNVKYQVDKANAFKVYKNYKTLSNLDYNLIANMAQRCIESITTKYNVIDVLGEKRDQVYNEIEDLLRKKLADEGVTFKMLTIKDTDAGEQIENAIQAEAVAKKQVETAEQQKAKAEIEAQTKLIEAQGDAEANAIKTKQLTKEILTEMYINKWDGHLPKVSGADSQMIDVSKLLED